MSMECPLTVRVDTQLQGPLGDVKPIICNLCANCFLDLTSFEDHYKTHLTEVDQSSVISNLQTQPQDTSHVLKPIICNLCFECFQDTAAFEDHYKLHLTDVDQSTVKLNLQTKAPPVPPLQDLNPLVSQRDEGSGDKAPDDQKPDVCHAVFESDTLLQDHQCENLHIKQQFVCEFCKKSFMSKEHLLSHIKTHEKLRKFKVGDNLLSNDLHVASTLENSQSCDDPSPQAPNLQAVITHRAVLQPNDISQSTDPQCLKKSHNRKYTCRICKKGFQFKCRLAKHKRTHKKTHTCLTCGKAFAQTYELVNHCKTHIQDLPFACDICNASFLTQRELDNHKLRHEEPLKCKYCDSVFYWKQSLLRHYQLQHARLRIENRSYSCKSCDETFSCFTRLRAHTIVMHENEVSNLCKFCSQHISCAIKMQSHLYLNHNIELHGEDQQHKCKGCQRSFEEKYQMDRHRCPYQMAKNEVETVNNKCNKCEQTFTYEISLRYHRCTFTERKAS